MSSDRHGNNNIGKPVTPALSTQFRTAVKTPLTPRVGVSAPSSPAIPPTHDARARTLSPGYEPPLPTSIDGNITTRSAARVLRTGTESPTTPVGGRVLPATKVPVPASVNSNQSRVQPYGLGITNPRSHYSPSPLSPPQTTSAASNGAHTAPLLKRRISASKSVVTTEGNVSSKFFHADDARSDTRSESGPQARAPFVAHVPGTLRPASTVDEYSVSQSQVATENKFFRANDTPVRERPLGTVRPQLVKQKSSPSFTVTRGSASSVTGPSRPVVRPTSPAKLATRTHIVAPSSPKRFQPRIPTPVRLSATIQDPADGRNSIGTPSTVKAEPTVNHRKSISADSPSSPSAHILYSPQRRSTLSLEFDPIRTTSPATVHPTDPHRLSPETLSPRSASLTSGDTAATSLFSESDRGETLPRVSVATRNSSELTLKVELKSPPLSPSQPHPPIDTATDARRERKVLDLEISNSSLLAINKTLERELRKQNTELRRFRRLSRAGRLSLNPSERSTSGLTVPSLDTLEESDEMAGLSDDDIDSDNLGEDDSIPSDDADSLQSTTAKAAQRARDEKRLMLDLSRHQQMLLDSQKLNQSITRCTNYTEELIKDCNKALEYTVGIRDVTLGGRVLLHDHFDDALTTEVGRQGLLSPSLLKHNELDSLPVLERKLSDMISVD